MPPADSIGVPSQTVALKLYSQLRDKPGNVIFSPFSIAEALAMVDVGARGQTATQLQSLLGAEPMAYGAWAKQLNGKHPDYELHSGNALWAQKGKAFEADFMHSLKEWFDAEPQSADFAHAAPAVATEINRWIDQQTSGKIKDLLSPKSLTPQTKLVLANAVYFKAKWVSTFKKETTRDQPFHTDGGKDITAAMMYQKHSFPLYGDDQLQLLQMPYRGNDLSMLVLLPRKVDGLADLEKSLTPEKLGEWSRKATPQSVKVTLPKFTMRQTLDLIPALRGLGVMDLVQPGNADLSGMDGSHELYVSAAAHGAFVKVDEEGTEAAAATVISAGATAVRLEKVEEFRADHPFLFIIRHDPTGGIVFMGRVNRPESAKE